VRHPRKKYTDIISPERAELLRAFLYQKVELSPDLYSVFFTYLVNSHRTDWMAYFRMSDRRTAVGKLNLQLNTLPTEPSTHSPHSPLIEDTLQNLRNQFRLYLYHNSVSARQPKQPDFI
jgi:hypothetical protein